MIVLFLNPMTANAEACNPVARAETRAALEAFLQREMVEPYQDGQWHKIFKRGGPLEWYNPPSGDFFYREFNDVGTLEDWIQAARDRWNKMLSEVPQV